MTVRVLPTELLTSLIWKTNYFYHIYLFFPVKGYSFLNVYKNHVIALKNKVIKFKK